MAAQDDEERLRAGAMQNARRNLLARHRAEAALRKQVEEALRESEEKHRTLADNLPSGFIYQIAVGADGSRRFSYVSGGVEALCGVTPAEVVADPVCLHRMILAEDQERVRVAEETAHQSGTRFDCQFRTYCGDGSVRWLHCRSAPRSLPGGRTVWDGIAIDVTDRRNAEEELRRRAAELAAADRNKDEFIALLAHELRNPLAPIRNGLHIMRLASADASAVAHARAMMERQLTHMVRLIDDLLDVSRINRNKMQLQRERVRLADVVDSAIETARPLIDAARHELTVLLPPSPVYLNADLMRLAQVFSNLLTNSAKYTPPGGRIELTAELRDGSVVVAIRDNGIGIPAESLPLIFDMFSQVDRSIERSSGGLGIGLALVKGLVETHGGRVTAASCGPDRGSTFTVTLPAIASLAEPASVASTSATAVGPQRRVLVVDDNRDGADSMALALRLLGNQVRTAHDGAQAIEAAEAFRPDVILMDIGMPRLNGYEATRRIRERAWGKAMNIIALTGWGQELDRDRSREAGCDGHLVKPVNLTDLEKLLSETGRPEARERT